jgi:AcrR family transcriptional regulator
MPGERSATAIRPAPVFRRPTADDAVALAREQFLAGERIEMRALAEQLDINRTTLYRWVGEREQLMGTVFSLLIDEWLELVRPEAEGEGIDLFLDVLRRFLELGAAFEPLNRFTESEPALALRILTDRDGPVTVKAKAVIAGLIDDLAPEVEASDDVVSAIGLVAQTLVWANIAADQKPDIERAVAVSRTLLEAARR